MKKGLFATSLTILLSVFLCGHASAIEEKREFYAFDASNGLADNSAQVVMCTHTGRMMVVTLGHVNFFDGYRFTHIDPRSDNAIALPGYQGHYQVYFDLSHHLWIKHDGLLTCLNLTTETFTNDVRGVLRQVGATKPVDDLYGDGVGNIWFRSGNTLYNTKLDKRFTLRPASVVQDVDVYRDSLLVMFLADASVAVYDYHTARFLYQDHALADSERGRYMHPSEICLVDNRYYQLRNGEHESVMLSYDVDRRQWTRLMEQPFLMNAICPKDGRIYIGSERGYLVHDIATGEQLHVETLSLSKGRTQRANINSMAFDRQGGMWIGTKQRGLLFAKAFPSPFHTYSTGSPEGRAFMAMMDASEQRRPTARLPLNTNCQYRDSRGWTWTGTLTGLELVRPDIDTLNITSKDGLSNNVIHSIIEDNQHDIWVSSSFGISHIYVCGGEVYHIEPYINQDNIPNETFVNNRVLKLSDGTIVMQSLDHFVAFNPAKFMGERFGSISINPKLVRLSVNGNDISAGYELDGQVITEKAVSRTYLIHVNYNQNSLSLTFSGLNYLRPIQTYYKVRVRGVEGYDDWRILSYGKSDGMVDKNGMLHLPLLGLPAGRYHVELQASLWPDVWPEEPYVWEIHVDQPWWRTTGLYLTVLLLLATVLLLDFYFYNRNTELRLVRKNEESDILRRIKSFVTRYASVPELSADVQTYEERSGQLVMSDEFVTAMQQIIPFVTARNGMPFTVSDLARIAGMDTVHLYDVLAEHLDKSPRQLKQRLRQLSAS